jgi:hypothetical protein
MPNLVLDRLSRVERSVVAAIAEAERTASKSRRLRR